jgi:hypothetical protein
MAQKQYPSISALSWHRHQYYSFFLPKDWQHFTWADERDGMVFGPDADDPLTIFAVDVKDLGMAINADDLDAVAEGFFGSIEALPGVEIESREQQAADSLIKLEAKYTFDDDGQTRKRWVRLYYHLTRQITMMAQGATPEKYDYWLPWFFEAMMTAKVHSTRPKWPN